MTGKDCSISIQHWNGDTFNQSLLVHFHIYLVGVLSNSSGPQQIDSGERWSFLEVQRRVEIFWVGPFERRMEERQLDGINMEHVCSGQSKAACIVMSEHKVIVARFERMCSICTCISGRESTRRPWGLFTVWSWLTVAHDTLALESLELLFSV